MSRSGDVDLLRFRLKTLLFPEYPPFTNGEFMPPTRVLVLICAVGRLTTDPALDPARDTAREVGADCATPA